MKVTPPRSKGPTEAEQKALTAAAAAQAVAAAAEAERARLATYNLSATSDPNDLGVIDPVFDDFGQVIDGYLPDGTRIFNLVLETLFRAGGKLGSDGSVITSTLPLSDPISGTVPADADVQASFALTDDMGQIVFGVAGGQLIAPTLIAEAVQQARAGMSSGGGGVAALSDGVLYRVVGDNIMADGVQRTRVGKNTIQHTVAGGIVYASNSTGATEPRLMTGDRGDVPLRDDLTAGTLLHVLGTGQSLSVGVGAQPIVSTAQPYSNVMFSDGVKSLTGTALVPLIEQEGSVPSMQGSATTLYESPMAGIANGYSKLLSNPNLYPVLASVSGYSGAAYVTVKPGSATYTNLIGQVTRGKTAAVAAGKRYAVAGLHIIHGESDNSLATADYKDRLIEWMTTFQADAVRESGQTTPLKAYISQFQSWQKLNSTTTPITPQQQWRASIERPDLFTLVGPKYMLEHVDGIHMTGPASQRLGEYHAKAMHTDLVQRKPWRPVSPRKITMSGNTITARFFVPAPPLVLDTALVSDPNGAYGFEFRDGSGSPPTITNVQVSGPDTVTITLSAAPTGPTPTLYAAWTGVAGAFGGPTTGPRACLRDSDATPSRMGGLPLHNYVITFDALIPYEVI